MKRSDRYIHKTYSIGKIFIKEGFYTKEQLLKILKSFDQRDLVLKKSMKPLDCKG